MAAKNRMDDGCRTPRGSLLEAPPPANATLAEINRSLPGDDLLADAGAELTMAISIDAPVDAWPWLVQLGQEQGGFYSYEWAENLVGLDIHNADRIVPEFQESEEGDPIQMVHEDYWLQSSSTSMTVERVDPGRTLVLRGHDGGTRPFGIMFEGELPTHRGVGVRTTRLWHSLQPGAEQPGGCVQQ